MTISCLQWDSNFFGLRIGKAEIYSVDDIEKLIVYLKNLGLTGIETHHSSQTKALQNKLSIIAQKHNLIESFGSDFHGENVKPGLKIGQIFREEKGNK